jgi:hypothetical protein
VTSENIGPEKLFSATVVRMVETPKPAAALATRAALLRSVRWPSIDLVAKAICDWKSIMIRVWSAGLSRRAPGVAVACKVIVVVLHGWWRTAPGRPVVTDKDTLAATHRRINGNDRNLLFP